MSVIAPQTVAMATWQQFNDEAPDLASAIAARLSAHKHHVIATLRKDGSPRVSGTEVEMFAGQLVLGSMLGARKALDLQREPRFALHSNPGHHTMDGGDAKISGRARELDGDEKTTIVNCYPENPGEAHFFVLDIEEAVLVTVDDERLHVDLWQPGKGIRRTTR